MSSGGREKEAYNTYSRGHYPTPNCRSDGGGNAEAQDLLELELGGGADLGGVGKVYSSTAAAKGGELGGCRKG